MSEEVKIVLIVVAVLGFLRLCAFFFDVFWQGYDDGNTKG